jgi:adenylate cyclase
LPAEELVKVLAEYLDILSDEVIQRQGTVDKFNGDDVMAFWGAPKVVAHPGQLACESALAGRSVILAMHPEWRRQGRPALRASFGIATGDVIVGNIGSRERMQYTVIGDAVNLASRLQGLNKAYQTEILIDVNTAKEAGPEYLTRCVDYVAVAGREEPIELRELLGRRDDLDAAAIMAVRGYEQGLQLYRDRKFAEAVDCLSETLKLWPDDGPSRVLRARAQDYMTAPPPEDWDAVTRFSVK